MGFIIRRFSSALISAMALDSFEVKMEKIPSSVLWIGFLGLPCLLVVTAILDGLYSYRVSGWLEVILGDFISIPLLSALENSRSNGDFLGSLFTLLIASIPMIVLYWLINKPWCLRAGKVRLRDVIVVLLLFMFLTFLFIISLYLDPSEASTRRGRGFGVIVSSYPGFCVFVMWPIIFLALFMSAVIKLAILYLYSLLRGSKPGNSIK